MQHKFRACAALVKSYPVIVSSLENEVSTTPSSADKSKLQGYLKILKSVKFMTNLLFFKEVLKPLGELSLALQQSSINFTHALASLSVFYQRVNKLRELCLREQADQSRYISSK